MRWYLCFLGTVTIPVQAASVADARAQVAADYFDRGITLAKKELKVRRAHPTDAGWLRDMGAEHVADALAAS